REPKVEMEDVGLREESREGGRLGGEPAGEAAAAVERDVSLRMELAAGEKDEPGVDAFSLPGLRVLPGGPRDVHGGVSDSKGHPMRAGRSSAAQSARGGCAAGAHEARRLRSRRSRA